MHTQILKPAPQYLTRLRLVTTITLLIILASCAFIVVPILFSPGGLAAAIIAGIIILGANALWYIPTILLLGPYTRSLRYEIQDDEVIVYAGIWTQSVKHVPYRTVTNLTVKRGVLDRWLGIGTLSIQTAGTGGTAAPEQSLAGLANVQAVYSTVTAQLHRFRGAMGPTAAEAEAGPVPSGDAINALLEEVRAIRQLLEERK